MTPSFQGNGPHWQGWQDMEQEDALDFIEGKVWGPSYHNLGSFIFFSKFVTGLVRPRLVIKPRVYIVNPSYRNKHLSSINQTSTFTFWLRPPLRSRSRVDFDEFFGQARLHRMTWPLACLWVSIMTYIITYEDTTDDWSLASRGIS